MATAKVVKVTTTKKAAKQKTTAPKQKRASAPAAAPPAAAPPRAATGVPLVVRPVPAAAAAPAPAGFVPTSTGSKPKRAVIVRPVDRARSREERIAAALDELKEIALARRTLHRYVNQIERARLDSRLHTAADRYATAVMLAS